MFDKESFTQVNGIFSSSIRMESHPFESWLFFGLENSSENQNKSKDTNTKNKEYLWRNQFSCVHK